MRSNGTAETVDDPACVNARPRRRRDPGSGVSPLPLLFLLVLLRRRPRRLYRLPVVARAKHVTFCNMGYRTPGETREQRANRIATPPAGLMHYVLRAVSRRFACMRVYVASLVCLCARWFAWLYAHTECIILIISPRRDADITAYARLEPVARRCRVCLLAAIEPFGEAPVLTLLDYAFCLFQ